MTALARTRLQDADPHFDPDVLQPQLEERGWALCPGLLGREQCQALRTWNAEAERFRTRVDMERHAFGRGDYGYFAAPLPEPIESLRQDCYPALASVANRWCEQMGRPERYPAALGEFSERCREAGQTQPTCLLLRYSEGGYNRMHQDQYGPLAFPLQVVVLLSRPGTEFEGGEFLVSEQRPRGQMRIEIARPAQGDAIVFPNAWRPVANAAGALRRTAVRHGLARVTRGERFALGLIFHDGQ